MDRQRVRGALRFFGETFAPLLIFYAFEHLVSLLAAIISGIACGVLIVAMQIKREKKASAFTLFVAGSVVGFGILDLRYQTGFFVKLEPALGNAITGLFFVGSVLWGAPVIIEFAERSLGRKIEKARGYLTTWTLLWGLFFFLRAGTYVWMAYNVSLDRALVVRGLAGPLSFVAMFGLEMATRFLLYGKRAFGKAAAESIAEPEATPALVTMGDSSGTDGADTPAESPDDATAT